MKTKILPFILLCFSLAVANEIAPTDDKIKIGQLENGLNFYIRENCYPEKKASLRLVVKVGSLHETDEEQGIAHFLEHLVFRGTKTFKDGDIEKYLESLGVWFGIDSNAMTTFDNTTYIIDLPMNNDEDITKSLTILKEMGFDAEISDSSVQKERKVVLDELHRANSNAGRNLLKKTCAHLLPTSLHAKRFPIGQKEIIENIKPQIIRNFYKKWYRPEKMAIIAVGDFDSNEIEKKIRTIFSNVVSSNHDLPNPDIDLTISKEPSVLTIYDTSLDVSSICLLSLYENNPTSSPLIEDVKEGVMSNMIFFLLNNRLNKKTHEGHFIYAKTFDNEYVSPKIGLLQAFGVIYEDKLEMSIRSLKTEIYRLLRYGITHDEWDMIRSSFQKTYSESFQNLDKVHHTFYTSGCRDHFLTNSALICNDWEVSYINELLESLSLEEINRAVTSFDFINPFTLVLATPSESLYKANSKELLLNLLEEEVAIEKAPTKKTEKQTTEISSLKNGKISQTIADETNDVKYLTLSNGTRVLLKKTDLQKGRFIIKAFAKGGLTLFSPKEFESAKIACHYRIKSGLGNFSYPELVDFLTEKEIGISFDFSYSFRNIRLEAPTKEQETLFDLLHQIFMPAVFNEKQWDIEVAMFDELTKQMNRNPDYQFQKFLTEKNTNDHYLFKPMNTQNLDKTTCKSIYNQHFSNITDFTFVIVGDFDQDLIEEHIEQYISSFTKDKNQETTPPKLQGLFSTQSISEDFRSGTNSYVKTILSKPCDMEESNHNHRYEVAALCKILENRLYKSLRKELGSTYNVSVGCYSLLDIDEKNKQVQIQFTSQAEDKDLMVATIKKDIRLLLDNPLTLEELNTAKKLLLESKNTSTLYNSFWENNLYYSEILQLPLDDIVNYKKKIEQITLESLGDIAKILFASPILSEISHYPAKNHM